MCLELGDVRFAQGPFEHQYRKLVEKVVQHRRAFTKDSAERPSLITAGDVQQLLQVFYDDE